MEVKFRIFSLLKNPSIVFLFLVISSGCIKTSEARIRNPLKIVSLEEKPNLMLIDPVTSESSGGQLILKDQYEGFSKDLAELLTTALGYDYELHLTPDKSYGKLHDQKATWNGMVGELVDNKSDIAIAGTTITSERSTAVDFSTPFLQFELGILIYDPNAPEDEDGDGDVDEDDDDEEEEDDEEDGDGQFIFLKPLTAILWIFFIVTTIVIAFLIFLVEKFVSAKIRGDVARDVGFFDGFCQKVFGAPRSVAARILQVVFWIFLIILLSGYIANFAADRVMDSSRHETDLPIDSYEDLLKQDDDFKFGIVRSGSTFHYFRSSEDEDMKKLYQRMLDDGTFLESYEQGVARVRKEKGKFAFIMEAPAAKFATTRKPCNLVLVPEHFGPERGYGVMTRAGSPISKSINLEIMKMKENGVMDDLQNKWFSDMSECHVRSEDSDFDIVHEHSPLSVIDMAGAFYFLVIALIISIIIGFLEINRSTAKYK